MRCSNFSTFKVVQPAAFGEQACRTNPRSPEISPVRGFISLLADDKTPRKGRNKKKNGERGFEAFDDGNDGDAARSAAVSKNCSSFVTVSRSSVPPTVFHAPLRSLKRSPSAQGPPPSASVDSTCDRRFGKLSVIITPPPPFLLPADRPDR